MRFQETRSNFAPTPRYLAALGLLVVASAAQAQTIGLNITGFTGSNSAPPDTDGAVGPTQIAEFINGGYAVLNKSTGGLVGSAISDTTFWNNAGISTSLTGAGLSDTRIIYDPSSSRWFASELTTSATGNQILVGVSKSSDLTAGWSAANYTAVSGNFGDFDTLSLDTNGVYISTNDFTSATGSGTGSNTLTSIPKSDLLLSTPSIANRSTFTVSSVTAGFALQGAYDTSSGTGAILGIGPNFGQISSFNVLGSGASGATLSPIVTTNVAATANPTQAGQPDGTRQIDTGDTRISAKPVKVGNYIVLAHTTKVGSNAAIRLTVLNATTGALLSEQTISKTGSDYYYPSLAINGSGQVVIGYNISGKSAGQYISSYAHLATLSGAGLLTLTGSDILLKAGTANYHLFGGAGERWGDYSTTVLDPSNPNTFWSFQEVALGGAGWSTQITQINTAATPAPSSLVVFAGAAIPGLIALRRKRRKNQTAS